MNLIDFLTSPWAIMPEKLLEIQAVYTSHFRGEKINIEAIEAQLGRPLANDQQEYAMREGGIAVLNVAGVISNKANMFTRVSGGASAQLLQKQVESMRADPRVRGVVFDFDTPGGNVLGIPSLAESINALASEKPTVSVSTGTMASAGYWLGSAANAVYISGLTDYVGSIGVVATHSYDPRQAAVQTTDITAGKFKRMAADNQPLSKEGKAYMQAQVDEIYRVFVETVAKNRRVDVNAVLENMADGRLFIGQQAIDAGLVDGVSTVDAMVEQLASNPDTFAKRRKAVFASASVTIDDPVSVAETQPNPKGPLMNAQELAAKFAAENPEAAALLRAEGQSVGAASERDRISGVRAAVLPGHEKLIEALAFDGKTTPAEAAMAVIAAERSKVSAVAINRAADAPTPVANNGGDDISDNKPKAATANAGAVPTGDAAENLDAAAKAYMVKHSTDYITAFKAISQGA